MISHNELLRMVSYDPSDGSFTLLVDTLRRKAGEKIGCDHGLGYLTIALKRKTYLAHRLAWFYVHKRWPKDQIDHINQDKKDNRLCNLREATNSQNHQNKKSRNRHGYKGVTLANSGKYGQKWQAKIKLKQRHIYLGTYNTPLEAHQAYIKAAKKMFGPYHCAEIRS